MTCWAPLKTRHSKAVTLALSDDPDGMLHNEAFHQSLQCLLKKIFREIFFLENITCDPSIYTMDHPDLIYQTLWEIPLVHKGLKHIQLNLPVKGFDHKMTLTFTGSIMYRQLLVHVSI